MAVKRLPPSTPIALALLCAAPAGAQEAAPGGESKRMEISFSAGAGSTDNVMRTESGEQSETILSAGMQIDIDEETRRLDTTVVGNLDYLHYVDDTFDDEMVGRLDANLRLALAPGRFFWDFGDNYGQAQVDPFAPVTPENREDVNYFSTGPHLGFKLGSSGFAEFAARYSDVAYEISPFDSQRIFVAAGAGRELASGSKLSLHADWLQTDFDQELTNTDYELGSAYVRYEVKGARTEFAANAGAIAFDGANEDTGPLLQISLTRQMSSASTLVLGAGHEFTDAATAFRDRPSLLQGVSSTGAATISSDVFTRNYVNLDWNYDRHRSGVVAAVRYSDDEYETRPELDVARTEFYLAFERQMTPAFTGRLFGAYSVSDYKNANFEDEVSTLGLSMGYLMGRHLSLTLDLNHEQRKVDGGGTGYDETRGFLRLNYRVR
jgi:hypothetical protein